MNMSIYCLKLIKVCSDADVSLPSSFVVAKKISQSVVQQAENSYKFHQEKLLLTARVDRKNYLHNVTSKNIVKIPIKILSSIKFLCLTFPIAPFFWLSTILLIVHIYPAGPCPEQRKTNEKAMCSSNTRHAREAHAALRLHCLPVGFECLKEFTEPRRRFQKSM